MWRYWSEAKEIASFEVEKPRLAVWARKDSKELAVLKSYLTDVEVGLGELPSSGLFLRLQIGVADPTKLLTHSDLDNYLYPLVTHLGPSRFVRVSGSKRVGVGSRVTVGIVEPTQEPLNSWSSCEIPAGRGKDTPERKEEIRRTLSVCQPTPLAGGEVELQVNWRCHQRVNWVTLWKPTIDAMGPILGEAEPPKYSDVVKSGTIRRNFNPHDGRITRLTLHRSDDSISGHAITIQILWRVPPASTSP